MSNVHDADLGRAVRTRGPFPMLGFITVVESHGHRPWTRYSVRFTDESFAHGLVLGEQIEYADAPPAAGLTAADLTLTLEVLETALQEPGFFDARCEAEARPEVEALHAKIRAALGGAERYASALDRRLTMATDAAYGPQEPIGTGDLSDLGYVFLARAVTEVTGNRDHDTVARNAAYLAEGSQEVLDAAGQFEGEQTDEAWRWFTEAVTAAIWRLPEAGGAS
jgi:hypothetical protein